MGQRLNQKGPTYNLSREIYPEKREQILTTKTIPFELPAPGVKIAVKATDQTGMEHMTVIDDPRNSIKKV